MRNSSRDKISPPINIKFQFPWGENRRRNCSKLFKFEIRVCVTLPSLYYSRPPYYVEIRCFPTVYEIGEPWPLVITSRHHSGKEYFRGSISKFAATNIQNLGPIISRPFEVSDPPPVSSIGWVQRARIVPASSLHKVRGTNARAFRETCLLLRETVIDTFEMQLGWNSLGEFGIPRFPVMWRGSV